MLPKLSLFLPAEEFPLLYQSESRVSSLEDAIHFFPGLFRLTKSIVVSEPLSTALIPGLEAVSESQLDITKDMSFGGAKAEVDTWDEEGLLRRHSNIKA